MSKKTLEARRQRIESRLERVTRRIVAEQKQLAQIEGRMAALTREQRKAA